MINCHFFYLFDRFRHNSTKNYALISSQRGDIIYEIDLSTLVVYGLNENESKVITNDEELFIHHNAKEIIDHSCKYFGGSMAERIKYTNRLVNMSSKTPIVVEESRNIIFFPLKSTREKVNIWIAFNNLEKYTKNGKKTTLIFKNGKEFSIDFSYYIIDNQVTRSLILDYEINKRRKSLEK